MPTEQFAAALRGYAPDFGVELAAKTIARLQEYYALLSKWNPRLHLVGPCAPEEFATRHVLESLLLLKHLSMGARVADIGSGAGLPIVPCLIARDDLRATLIEASQKKSVFLQETLRLIQANNRASVVNARFETIPTLDADFVTCRALDKFSELLPAMIEWAPPTATLLLFVGEPLRNRIEGMLTAVHAERIPHSDSRLLVVGRR
ncbi:MAG TPA: 16S rRNA (guanine(527)-N(7))-methyltransferase RsmG [Pyrinomonadaceae bacterium]|nr:16S rRNA (guanine(527)-N(7))-methyltransferase RsmG [Pyrinomonadaceae bacterium]